MSRRARSALHLAGGGVAGLALAIAFVGCVVIVFVVVGVPIIRLMR